MNTTTDRLYVTVPMAHFAGHCAELERYGWRLRYRAFDSGSWYCIFLREGQK